jgi:Ca2+-binding RTX toxin-like protein
VAVYQANQAIWNNDGPGNTEQQTAIERLADGKSVVAWVDGNNGDNNIRAQILDAAGVPSGNEFIVNAPYPGNGSFVKFNLDIQTLADGNFAVAWDEIGRGSNGNGIVSRVFATDGTPVSDEFLAGTYSNESFSSAYTPEIVAGSGDQFWIVSTSQLSNGNYSIYRQQVDSDGNILSARQLVNETAAQNCYEPETAKLSNGNILVTWIEYDGLNSTAFTGISARLFDSSFNPLGVSFEVTPLVDTFGFPHLSAAPLPNGGFAIAWTADEGNDGGYPTLLQRYDAAAAALGTPLLVGEAAGLNGDSSSDLTALADGSLLVTFSPSGEPRNVYGQIIDTAGNLAGTAFHIATPDNNSQIGVAVTGLTGGGFATTYIGGNDIPGDGWSVKASTFQLLADSGTAGDDVIVLRTGHVGVANGLGGNDEMIGNNGNNSLAGGEGADLLYGGGGNDRLDGGDGDDLLVGGAGADTFVGSTGRDTVSYAAAVTGVSASLTTVASNTGEAAGDRFSQIEVLLGSAFADTLEGNSGGNSLYGGAGGDTLIGLGGSDRLEGGEGTDIVYGGDGSDTLYGGADTDTFYGGEGADRMFGGDGDDTFWSGAGVDTFAGDAGVDTVTYANAASGIRASLLDSLTNTGEATGDRYSQIENLRGSDFADTLAGNNGGNAIYGGEGADSIAGLDGTDQLHGDGGADVIDGGRKNDQLFGGDGADVLIGGAGSDTMTGGADADIFRFLDLTDFASDVVTDFDNAADRIDFSAVDTDAVTPGDQAFAFIGNAAFTVSGSAQIRFMKETERGSTLVQVDTDGDATADVSLRLTGLVTLDSADFIL